MSVAKNTMLVPDPDPDHSASLYQTVPLCSQVMNQGQVAEYDTPYNLLQNKSSLLYRMVEKTGPDAARELHDMVTRPE